MLDLQHIPHDQHERSQTHHPPYHSLMESTLQTEQLHQPYKQYNTTGKHTHNQLHTLNRFVDFISFHTAQTSGASIGSTGAAANVSSILPKSFPCRQRGVYREWGPRRKFLWGL